MIYALWHGGSSYGPSYVDEHLEQFERLSDVYEAMRERIHAHRIPATFRPVDGEPYNVLCPCVEESSMDVYFADPRGSSDPVPDMRIEQGARGTVRRVA